MLVYLNDLEYKPRTLISRSISSGSSVKIVADTPICSLLERIPIAVLIIEPLLILSINNGPKITFDGIVEPMLMTFSIVIIMSYMLNLVIYIIMILLDLLQYLVCIVVIDISSTFYSVVVSIYNSLFMFMIYC
jgi:hypothetical protein